MEVEIEKILKRNLILQEFNSIVNFGQFIFLDFEDKKEFKRITNFILKMLS